MLKGKTIQSVIEEMDSYGIRNTVVSESPAALVPRKILNDVAGYLPDEIQHLVSSGDYPIKTMYYVKSIASSTSDSVEVIQETKNLRYTLQELKDKFPGFANLYYVEIFDLLESTDYNLTPNNLNSNLQKFLYLGNNIQSQISRLHTEFNTLQKKTFGTIKEETSSKIKFFTSNSEIEILFEQFNQEINLLYNSLYNRTDINLDKYNLIDLYFEFFSFISDELIKKNFCTAEEVANSTIGSRLISLNNSKIVLGQFKTLLEIESNAAELELNNIKDYLDVIKPSLYLLKQQNFKDFKEQFKNLIKS